MAGAPTLPYYAPQRELSRQPVLEVNERLGMQPTRNGFSEADKTATKRKNKRRPIKKSKKSKKE